MSEPTPAAPGEEPQTPPAAPPAPAAAPSTPPPIAATPAPPPTLAPPYVPMSAGAWGPRDPARRRWLLPTLTGVAGLVLGLLIGGLGVAAIGHHRHQFGPGDLHGRYLQGPFQGYPPGIWRPGQPLPTKPPALPSPNPT
jgi:hypothetical protein